MPRGYDLRPRCPDDLPLRCGACLQFLPNRIIDSDVIDYADQLSRRSWLHFDSRDESGPNPFERPVYG